jgi:hypothetical protein
MKPRRGVTASCREMTSSEPGALHLTRRSGVGTTFIWGAASSRLGIPRGPALPTDQRGYEVEKGRASIDSRPFRRSSDTAPWLDTAEQTPECRRPLQSRGRFELRRLKMSAR